MNMDRQDAQDDFKSQIDSASRSDNHPVNPVHPCSFFQSAVGTLLLTFRNRVMLKRFSQVLCLSLLQWNGIAVDVSAQQDESKFGEKQYRWLKASLESVDAKYRFVFLHHLVGGSPTNNRGGVEASKYWEWGGMGSKGENEFAKQRPGWEMPIHDLLVHHGLSIVFHGHDHLFVKQELDGIVYQEVPQPGHPRSGNTNTAREYGYLSGETQSSSGFIRVRVGGDSARADDVRTYLPGAESQSKKNGDVSFSYVVPKLRRGR